MTAQNRPGRARSMRRCAPLLGLLGLWGALSPAWGQEADPEGFDIFPDAIEQGECYTIDVETPSITLDVQYSLNGGPTRTIYGWPRIGPYGTVEVCTSTGTDLGTYEFTAARNADGGEWIAVSATLTVIEPTLPDFTITATPGRRTVAPGGSAAYTVSVTASNGFNQAVALSASGSGVTAAFTSASLTSPYTGSSRMTLTAGASVGHILVTVTGTGGGLTRTAQVYLTVWDFTITAAPASQTVVSGESASYTVSVAALNGFDQPVALSASAPGVTASLSSSSLSSPYTGSSTLTLSATSSGTYTVTVTGMGGGLRRITTVSLTVQDFTITATPASRTVVSGESATYAVSVAALHGFNQAVALSASGPGVTASLSSSSLSSPYTGSSTLTLSATSPGTYTVTVTGESGTLEDTATVTLTVQDFTITATPGSQTVVSGESATYAVSVAALHGFNQAVALSASGPGVTASLSSSSLSSPYTGSSTLTLSATSPGTYTVTVTGESGTLEDTATVTLTVQDFTITATPNSRTVMAGETASYTVTVAALHGFDETVSLSASEPGVTAMLSSSSVTHPYTDSTLRLSASPGTYKVTVTGRVTSGTLERTATVTLTVEPDPYPDFTITATPGSQTIVSGESATYAVSVAALHGFNQAVALSASGPGVTASLSSSSLSSPYTGSSTLTLSATSPGTYTVTVTGESGTLEDTATVTLTVQDFTITATPNSRTVMAGESASYTVTVAALHGFDETISLSASEPGVTAMLSSSSVTHPYTDSTLRLSASPGTYKVTVTGRVTSGTLERTATVTLTVEPDPYPDFTITATPNSRTVVEGESASYTVTVEALHGFNQAVSLNASGAGVTASLSSPSLSSPYTGSSTLTLSASPGTYTVTVTGRVTSGTLERTATVTLTVNPQQPTTMSVSPAIIPKGACYTLTVGATVSMTLDIKVTLNGGAEYIATEWELVSPIPFSTTGPATAHRCTGGNTAVGDYVITAMKNTLNDDWVTVNVSFSVTDPPQPTSMSVSPSSVDQGECYTMNVGTTATMTLDVQHTLTPPGGIPGPVQTIYGWPFIPVTPFGPPNAYICTDTTTAVGEYVFTAMKNTLHTDWVTVDASITVYPVPDGPDFTITATPSSRAVAPGGSTTYTVSVTAAGGFSQAVALSVTSMLPTGVTASFDSARLTHPYTDSTMTVTVGSGVSDGTSMVTVTGTSGVLTRPATVSLTIGTAGPGLRREYIYLGGRVIAVESP